MARKQSMLVTKLVSAFKRTQMRNAQVVLADEILHRAGPELCKEIIDDWGDKHSLLFHASVKQSYSLIEFLITECHANVETRGYYSAKGEEMAVTSLWHAAAEHQTELVKRLAELGASVNVPAKGGETPLMRACTNDDFDMVQLLVSLEADIYQTDDEGSTCLMKAVLFPHICRYLLDHGPRNINAQNDAGDTALHCATRQHMGTAFLLLDCDADPYLLNAIGEDMLQIACTIGNEQCILNLRDKCPFDTERLASCLELLGAVLWPKCTWGDYEQVFSYWEEACTLRSENGLVKRVLPATAQYAWLTEFADQTELDNLNWDPVETGLQSLLVCERVLGAAHHEFHSQLNEVGLTLLDEDEIGEAVTSLVYSLDLQIRHPVRRPDTSDTLPSTMIYLLDALRVEDVHPLLSFEQALNVLFKLIKMYKVLSSYPKRPVSADILVDICPFILQYIMSLPRTPAEEFELRSYLCCVLHYDGLVKASGESLLHVSVGMYIVEKRDLFTKHSYVPDVELIRLLLDCGPRVDELDRNHNTPLHKAVQAKNHNKEIVDLLLSRGAHIDRCNVFGVTPLSMFPTRPKNELEFTSLKCLAARVVQEYGLSSESSVPRELHKFAKLH